MDEDDRELWKSAMQDVKPLKDRENNHEKKPALEKISTKYPLKQKARDTTPRPQPRASLPPKDIGHGLDRRTAERLTRGEMTIEARLDMHGLTQPEAHQALQHFILKAYERGQRCLLIVTGKGRTPHNRGKGTATAKAKDAQNWFGNEPGVLRRKTPQWLADPALAPLILKTSAARPKDGGDGALYILLRRKRERTP